MFSLFPMEFKLNLLTFFHTLSTRKLFSPNSSLHSHFSVYLKYLRCAPFNGSFQTSGSETVFSGFPRARSTLNRRRGVQYFFRRLYKSAHTVSHHVCVVLFPAQLYGRILFLVKHVSGKFRSLNKLLASSRRKSEHGMKGGRKKL